MTRTELRADMVAMERRLGDRLTRVEEAVTTHSGEIRRLDDSVTAHSAQIRRLEDAVTTHSAEVRALRGDFGRLRREFEDARQ